MKIISIGKPTCESEVESCGVGDRHDWDLILLQPWCRPAAEACDLTASLGTSTCHQCGPKKGNEKNPGVLCGIVG